MNVQRKTRKKSTCQSIEEIQGICKQILLMVEHWRQRRREWKGFKAVRTDVRCIIYTFSVFLFMRHLSLQWLDGTETSPAHLTDDLPFGFCLPSCESSLRRLRVGLYKDDCSSWAKEEGVRPFKTKLHMFCISWRLIVKTNCICLHQLDKSGSGKSFLFQLKSRFHYLLASWSLSVWFARLSRGKLFRRRIRLAHKECMAFSYHSI